MQNKLLLYIITVFMLLSYLRNYEKENKKGGIKGKMYLIQLMIISDPK